MPELTIFGKKRLGIWLFSFSLLLLALAMIATPQALAESTVYGKVYDWSTFDVINHSVVMIDTVPVQKVVSTNGSYSLKIPEGNYTISATSGYGSKALYGYENITVSGSGEYKIDLLLFPDSNLTALEIFGQHLPSPTPDAPPVTDNQPPGNAAPETPGILQDSLLPAAIAGFVLVAIIVSAIAGYVLAKRRKPAERSSKPDTSSKLNELLSDTGTVPAPEPDEPAVNVEAEAKQEQVIQPVDQPHAKPSWERVLRPDCKSVIATIEKNGGRITQLDLRKSLPYSEAKISLIISELEDAGYLKKIKRGRGNVLILTCPDGFGADRQQG
ncbi:helix-turn-helix transcriptional regulator [Methanocella sp. MCL-LM]|uniref:helix-turn-helix transcriptional regulator n=1 Tax=Methanocella sp. MCL-LM TaxID=3412035 RepID=UPI003C786888